MSHKCVFGFCFHFCIFDAEILLLQCRYLMQTIQRSFSPLQHLFDMLWFFFCFDFSSCVLLHTSFSSVLFFCQWILRRTRYKIRTWQWLYELWLVFSEMDMFMLTANIYSIFMIFTLDFFWLHVAFSLAFFLMGQEKKMRTKTQAHLISSLIGRMQFLCLFSGIT